MGAIHHHGATNSVSRAGIHAVRAIVTDGLNRDRIEPPQPTFFLFSQQLAADSAPDPTTTELADCAKTVL
ncbi:MAG: hypothetical protein ABIU05_18060, partial [Nitrospirales bacterium]